MLSYPRVYQTEMNKKMQTNVENVYFAVTSYGTYNGLKRVGCTTNIVGHLNTMTRQQIIIH